GVNASPNAQAKPRSAVDDGHGASNCARRTVESRQEPIAGRVDLIAAIELHVAAHQTVMCFEQRTPAAVAELTGVNRRVRDGGEHDRRQDSVECLCTPDAGEELLYLAENRVGVSDEPEMVAA